MDMKRILQAMDGVASKPVEGVNNMSKFLRVVKEAELNQPAAAPQATPVAPASTLSPEQLAYNQLRAQLDSAESLRGGANTYADVSPEVTASTNSMKQKLAQMAAALTAKGIDAAAEYDAPDPAVPAAVPVDLNQKYNDTVTEDLGMSRMLSIVTEAANPHKVALPVQMAMQHYAIPKEIEIKKPSLLKGYLSEVTEEVAEEAAHKRQLMNQYAQTIAERVLMRESRLDEKSKSEKQARFMAAAAHDPQFAARTGIKQNVAKEFNKADTGTKQLSQAMKNKKKKINEMPIDMTGDPNDPTVYGHEKANPMSLKGRIQQARNQLKELANMAESDDLASWQRITQLAKGGMFMGLEQNLEQIRHGIEQLAAKRKQGGIASRGIDKNIGEVYDGEPDEYHVLRHQTKDDIDKEITMPAAWTKVKEFDGYQEAKAAYLELKNKYPNDKFTVTTHNKSKRDAFRKQHGLNERSVDQATTEDKDPCWKDYKQIGTKKKGGKTVPNCVPKE